VYRVWRLHTTRGLYEVKQFYPAFVREKSVLDDCRLTDRIAVEMARRGIPAVVPLVDVHGDMLCIVEDEVFQVYAWVDGIRLSIEEAMPTQAHRVGQVLAQIHVQRFLFSELPTPSWELLSYDELEMLAFQAADRGVSWAQRVHTALPRLGEWSRRSVEAGVVLEKMLVVSHRSLDQQNVLWKDGQLLAIVDWDAAGLINPTMELVSVALMWSGLLVGMPQEERFMALLEGYVAGGGVIDEAGYVVIDGVTGKWLAWLLFAMYRSLGELVLDEQEREQSGHEVLQVLTMLYALDGHKKMWAEWIERYR
jgi:Ser/Thr protein kinase RdoA (MazF antagonist)